jgi:hypothetical protein
MTYVVLPPEMAERNRVHILVENNGDRNGKIENIETLRAK